MHLVWMMKIDGDQITALIRHVDVNEVNVDDLKSILPNNEHQREYIVWRMQTYPEQVTVV
jgi:hypothetical protein